MLSEHCATGLQKSHIIEQNRDHPGGLGAIRARWQVRGKVQAARDITVAAPRVSPLPCFFIFIDASQHSASAVSSPKISGWRLAANCGPLATRHGGIVCATTSDSQCSVREKRGLFRAENRWIDQSEQTGDRPKTRVKVEKKIRLRARQDGKVIILLKKVNFF